LGTWENVVGIKQGEKENRDRFNRSPRLLLSIAKKRGELKKFLKDPLTLALSHGVERREKERI
jgi:hypothetical protein